MKKLNAATVYLIYNGATSLFFAVIFTVNMVYQATVVGLNPLQLVLVGTLLEISTFLFEVPTGIVADVYSRRLSIIIGVFLIGVGFIVEGSFPWFATVLLAQVLWGLGYTFTSGATEAWIADEIGEERAGKAFLQGTRASLVGGLIGAILSVSLGSIRVNVPILTGGVLFLLLGVFLMVVMPEQHFIPARSRENASAAKTVARHWQDLRDTFRAGVGLIRGRQALTAILLVGLFFGLYSEGYDRLWTPHLLQDITLPVLGQLKPVIWFGIINIGSTLLALIVTSLAQRAFDPDQPLVAQWLLLTDSILLIAGLVFFALTRSFVAALGAIWLISCARSLNGPYFTAWVNRHLTSDIRATVLSMSSQVDAFGQILGGPILGVVGNSISIRAAIIGSAGMLAPVLPLLGRLIQVEVHPASATPYER